MLDSLIANLLPTPIALSKFGSCSVVVSFVIVKVEAFIWNTDKTWLLCVMVHNHPFNLLHITLKSQGIPLWLCTDAEFVMSLIKEPKAFQTGIILNADIVMISTDGVSGPKSLTLLEIISRHQVLVLKSITFRQCAERISKGCPNFNHWQPCHMCLNQGGPNNKVLNYNLGLPPPN